MPFAESIFRLHIEIGLVGDVRFMVDQEEKITSPMIKPTKVKALDGYQIWVEFEDGVHGKIDLSRYVGCGVWKAWEDRSLFESVKITPYRAIGWSERDNLDMCADWAYMKVRISIVDGTR